MRLSAVTTTNRLPESLKRRLTKAVLSLLVLGAETAPGEPPGSGKLTDDQVARWVLSSNAGPNFVTFSEGGVVTQVTDPAKLPTGRYDVISISFTSLDQVTPEHLGNVGRLAKLGFLEFKDGSVLSAQGVAAIAESDSLGSLIINKVSLNDADLVQLSRIKSLKTLALRHCPKLTGAVWRGWSGWGLTTFSLGGWGIAREHLPKLAGLKSLQTLTIDGPSGLVPEDFAGWSHPGVWQLWLTNASSFTGHLRPVLEAFPRVKQVYIHGTPISSEDCSSLAQLRLLGYLQLSGTNIGDTEVPALAASRTMSSLDWYGFTGAGTSLDQLAQCRQLRVLGLIDGQLGDAGIAKLATLRQVDELTLTGNLALTDAGLAPLASMKQLRTLRLGKTALTNAGLLKLAELRKLEVLDVTGCPHITPDGVGNLLRLLPKCKVAFQ